MSPMCVLGIAAGLCLLTLLLAVVTACRSMEAADSAEEACDAARAAKQAAAQAKAAATPPAPGRVAFGDEWYDEDAPEKFQ